MIEKKKDCLKSASALQCKTPFFGTLALKFEKHLNEKIHSKKIERFTFARYVEAGLGFVLEKVNSMTTDKTHHYPGLKGLF